MSNASVPAKGEIMFPIYEFRPEGFYEKRDWLRYADGAWIPDDGEHDIAFAVNDSRGAPFCLYFKHNYQKNIIWSWLPGHWSAEGPHCHPQRNPWHYMLREGEAKWGGEWKWYNNHPNRRASDAAMNFVADRYRCANGRGPEFHIGDPFIAKGLVRRADTKEIVTFPREFRCMYCGVVDITKAAA